MANLIHCNNGYVCSEGLTEFLLSLIYLSYLVTRYRIITQDKSGVLVQIDRYLCFAALIQIFLQTIYFLYFGKLPQSISCADNDFVLSTIKCMGIAMQIMICNILGSIVADEEQAPKVWQLARALLIGAFILWFWAGIVHKSAIDYNCVQVDYLIVSSFGLILAGGSFYMGNMALEGHLDYKNKLDIARSGNIQVQQHAQKYEQVLIRIKQITLMHCIQQYYQIVDCYNLEYNLRSTYLPISNVKIQGNALIITMLHRLFRFYLLLNYIKVLYLTIFKLIQFTTLPASIFWIFYEMNKTKFQEEDRNTFEMNITQ